MNECIGHVIGKPHSPVTGLYIGKMTFAVVMLSLFSSPVLVTFAVQSQHCRLAVKRRKACWIYNHHLRAKLLLTPDVSCLCDKFDYKVKKN